MTGKHRLIAIIAGCCLLIVTGVGVGLWYRQHSQPSKPPPVFEMDSDDYTDDDSLKKSSVPTGEQILAALRSDDREAIESAYVILQAIATDERAKRLWPDDLSKKRVYDQIRRHLEDVDGMAQTVPLFLLNPQHKFGKEFYQSERDIKMMRRAIKRINEHNREKKKEGKNWLFYELVLNEDGEPVKIKWWGGGSVH